MSDAADYILLTNNLSKHYENGRIQALRGITIRVRRGEFVAVMGPSGSGKSTLLHLIGGLDTPTSGEIYVNGSLITDGINLDEFRSRTVGFIFQAFYLIPTLTALENVQIPMFETVTGLAERRNRAEKLLQQVALGSRLNHYPAQLSGGERQRVAIARSLANSPLILLADEPTGNLDSKTAVSIIDLIKKINRENGVTIIIVTHDENIAKECTRTIRLLDGFVVD